MDIKGSIIAYSCKEGTVSYGYDNSIVSPFTECLLNNIYRNIDIGRIFRYCNYELSLHAVNSNGSSQQSRYTDALRSSGDLVLNECAKETKFIMKRYRVICRKDPNTPVIWATHLEGSANLNIINYYPIPQNSEVEVLIEEDDWRIQMKPQVILTSQRPYVELQSGEQLELTKGIGFPFIREDGNNYIASYYSKDENDKNDFTVTNVKILKENSIIQNKDYWVKVKVLNSNYVGYIAGTYLPDYLRQTLLPYFTTSYSYWSG